MYCTTKPCHENRCTTSADVSKLILYVSYRLEEALLKKSISVQLTKVFSENIS